MYFWSIVDIDNMLVKPLLAKVLRGKRRHIHSERKEAGIKDMEQRRPTIYDIAKTAGVSHMTVSRYLRFNGERTREDPRERIKAAITDLDYRPNLAARALRTNRTGRLAILFPYGSAASSVHMLTGATEAAREAGYQVDAITLAGSSAERSERTLELAEAGLFEGLLALTPLVSERHGQIASRVPVVVGAEYDDEMRGIGDLADASPVAEIIETLAQQGHRRFLHIAGDRTYTTVRSREQAYLETIERLGLESAGVLGGDWLGETARRAVLDLPEEHAASRPSSPPMTNSPLPPSMPRSSGAGGYPKIVSVAGWDNNPLGQWLPPTLTTVKVDYEELGRRSMAKLLAASTR
jgi:DNA-binding LacI/PurR family transcriptional regulator